MPTVDEIKRRKRSEGEDEPEGKKKGNGKGGGTHTGYQFELIPFENLKPGTEPLFLVKGLIPKEGLALVWGPPKCGKSFWTFDLVMHVALGRDYRGLRVLQGLVVYCAFEGASGFRLRAEAFRRSYPDLPDEVDFFLMGRPTDMAVDHPEMIEDFKLQLKGARPSVVVLDTVNRSLNGSENNPEDMGGYVRAADMIRAAFDCVVILVHHCGVDEKRPRGHTSLIGAVDAQIKVIRDVADNVVVEVERMKDGEEGQTVTSRLERMVVGIDDNGQEMTSCIVKEVFVADKPEGKAKTKKPRLSPTLEIALRALHFGVSREGVPPPEGFPDVTRKVIGELAWRRHAYAMGISIEGQEAKKKAFRRAADKLIADKLVLFWEGWVCPS